MSSEGQDMFKESVTPMIVFLTDGAATRGMTDSNTILKDILRQNMDKVPIFALAFGHDADYKLIKDLSSQNYAFARKIFAEFDATLQMENFYAEISSPLLKNVTINT